MSIVEKVIVHGEEYEWIRDFKDNQKLRAAFNQLTQKIFQFDFEKWYQAGYWKGSYCPFALMKADQCVANVSANILEFACKGEVKKAIQIGTVMTDPDYRHRGLSRFLMERVLEEFEDKTDFQYLFAGDKVLDFYPKFGFESAEEIQCKGRIKRKEEVMQVRKLDLDQSDDLDLLLRIGNAKVPNAQVAMVGNFELNMFYCGFFLRDQLYYLPEVDAVAVASLKEDHLLLYEVFACNPICIEDVVHALMTEDEMDVSLGFSPVVTAGFEQVTYKEEDRTLFMRGRQMGKVMFPLLSQA